MSEVSTIYEPVFSSQIVRKFPAAAAPLRHTLSRRLAVEIPMRPAHNVPGNQSNFLQQFAPQAYLKRSSLSITRAYFSFSADQASGFLKSNDTTCLTSYLLAPCADRSVKCSFTRRLHKPAPRPTISPSELRNLLPLAITFESKTRVVRRHSLTASNTRPQS